MRLGTEQLFYPDLTPIGDETLSRKLDEAFRREFVSGYQSAVREEMLQHPECTLSQMNPLETV